MIFKPRKISGVFYLNVAQASCLCPLNLYSYWVNFIRRRKISYELRL